MTWSSTQVPFKMPSTNIITLSCFVQWFLWRKGTKYAHLASTRKPKTRRMPGLYNSWCINWEKYYARTYDQIATTPIKRPIKGSWSGYGLGQEKSEARLPIRNWTLRYVPSYHCIKRHLLRQSHFLTLPINIAAKYPAHFTQLQSTHLGGPGCESRGVQDVLACHPLHAVPSPRPIAVTPTSTSGGRPSIQRSWPAWRGFPFGRLTGMLTTCRAYIESQR